ncbi:MAG: formate dehydrogenase [Bryobacterales bacterium]|jgi:formate dehydrogenase subunit delta|nr:formate dehydrogenase [Bryobacterales bacterium]
MDPHNMVHMANQIALNFAAYPHEEAVANVTNHLKSFWERRMKQQLHEYVAKGGGGLHELVIEAEKRLK